MATPEAAAEAVSKGGISFPIFILVLIVCASVAGFAIYVQRKRYDDTSLLQGIDNQYDEMMDQLEQLALEFDVVFDAEPAPRKMRIALIKRARGVLPIVQAVQRELQQKEGMLREGTVRKEDFESLVAIKERVEEEIAEIKARADELKAGLGDKVFKMVQGQQYQLIAAVERNVKEYNELLEGSPSVRDKKLGLIVKRAVPVLDFLAQINKIPLENLRSEGKIDEEEFENFMSLKEMLEEEKVAVEEEAEVVQAGFAEAMARLIEHQKQLFNVCRQVDQIVREYESFIDDDNMSNRQKILALIVRRSVAIRKFDLDLQRAGEQVTTLHQEGKVEPEQFEMIMAVKDRMEGAMAATRREGNRLKKGLGAKLEAVYDAQAENYKQVILMEQRLVEYSTQLSQAANMGLGEINPQIRLKMLFEKRLMPAVELEKKLQAEQSRLEQLRSEGKGDSHEFEAFMGIKERVLEELENIREEADEVEAGAGEALVNEANGRMQAKDKKEGGKGKERKPESIQERLKMRHEEKKDTLRSSPSRSSSGSLGAMTEDDPDKAAKEQEAERAMAELLAQEEKEGGAKKKGGKKGKK